MAYVSNHVIDFLEAASDQSTPAAVGRVFLDALRPFGARAIYARAYHAPARMSTEEQVYSRIAPSSCDQMYADRRFYEYNPIPRQILRCTETKRWSELRWRSDGERWVGQALHDNGCPDGLAIPCHGPRNYLGLVSLAFERLDQVAPEERRAIELAGLALHNRMRSLAPGGAGKPGPRLTRREADCIAFIAEGRSDEQIGTALNVSRATVATHVANARQKLGAKTRAQAVAIYLFGTDPVTPA